MKFILFILFIIGYISCQCPECTNFLEPMRLIYQDSIGNNLLDSEALIVQDINCNDMEINFILKDFIIPGSSEKTHIEIDAVQLYENCLNVPCTLKISINDDNMDMLIYQCKEIKDKCCSFFQDSKMIYNGQDILGSNEGTIGAYVIVK